MIWLNLTILKRWLCYLTLKGLIGLMLLSAKMRRVRRCLEEMYVCRNLEGHALIWVSWASRLPVRRLMLTSIRSKRSSLFRIDSISVF